MFRVVHAILAFVCVFGDSVPLAFGGNGLARDRWGNPVMPNKSFGGQQAQDYQDANDLLDGKLKPYASAEKGWGSASNECDRACDSYPKLHKDLDQLIREAEQAEAGLEQGGACPGVSTVAAQLRSSLNRIKAAKNPIWDNFKAASAHQTLGGAAAIRVQAIVLPGSQLDGAGKEEELIQNSKRVAQILSQAGQMFAARPEQPCQRAGKAMQTRGKDLQREAQDLENGMRKVKDGANRCVFAWARGRVSEGQAAGIGLANFQVPDLNRVANAGSYACTAAGYSTARESVVAKASEALKKAVKPTNIESKNALNALKSGPGGKPFATTSTYGYRDDKYKDAYSLKGIGVQNRRLHANSSLALSDSIATRLGARIGDTIGYKTADGQVHLGVYDDRVPNTTRTGKYIPPRIDHYNPHTTERQVLSNPKEGQGIVEAWVIPMASRGLASR